MRRSAWCWMACGNLSQFLLICMVRLNTTQTWDGSYSLKRSTETIKMWIPHWDGWKGCFKDSGSNLHQDPDLMGAWNLLLIGDFMLFENQLNWPKAENGGRSTLLPSLSTLSTAMEGELVPFDPLIFLLGVLDAATMKMRQSQPFPGSIIWCRNWEDSGFMEAPWWNLSRWERLLTDITS